MADCVGQSEIIGVSLNYNVTNVVIVIMYYSLNITYGIVYICFAKHHALIYVLSIIEE